MNKFTKQEITIEQYLSAFEGCDHKLKYLYAPSERIEISTALAKLINRYLGKINTREYNAEKLEFIKEFCDEYITVQNLSTNSSYQDWTVLKIAQIPADIKENIFAAAKEPSEREKDERIRKNIGKLLDK